MAFHIQGRVCLGPSDRRSKFWFGEPNLQISEFDLCDMRTKRSWTSRRDIRKRERVVFRGLHNIKNWGRHIP